MKEIVVDGVILEDADITFGWAVFTGIDGEDIDFHAFFHSKKSALDYLEMCKSHPNEDYRLCDPDIAPAGIMRTEDGVKLLAANHFDWEKGARAVVKYSDINEVYAERFLKEAAEK